MDIKHAFVVNRALWINGSELSAPGYPSLLDASTGNMCCLGHLCKSLDIEDDAMRGLGWHPLEGSAGAERFEQLLRKPPYVDESECGSIGSINDMKYESREVKEQRLTEKFASLGIVVRFEGDLP